MVNTELEIDEETYEALKAEADNQKKSVPAVAGEIIRENLIESKKHTGKDDSFLPMEQSKEVNIYEYHEDCFAEDY